MNRPRPEIATHLTYLILPGISPANPGYLLRPTTALLRPDGKGIQGRLDERFCPGDEFPGLCPVSPSIRLRRWPLSGVVRFWGPRCIAAPPLRGAFARGRRKYWYTSALPPGLPKKISEFDRHRTVSEADFASYLSAESFSGAAHAKRVNTLDTDPKAHPPRRKQPDRRQHTLVPANDRALSRSNRGRCSDRRHDLRKKPATGPPQRPTGSQAPPAQRQRNPAPDRNQQHRPTGWGFIYLPPFPPPSLIRENTQGNIASLIKALFVEL